MVFVHLPDRKTHYDYRHSEGGEGRPDKSPDTFIKAKFYVFSLFMSKPKSAFNDPTVSPEKAKRMKISLDYNFPFEVSHATFTSASRQKQEHER